VLTLLERIVEYSPSKTTCPQQQTERQTMSAEPLMMNWDFTPAELAENEWWESHPHATQEQFEREFELSRS
jgi:hypothetical protein